MVAERVDEDDRAARGKYEQGCLGEERCDDAGGQGKATTTISARHQMVGVGEDDERKQDVA